MRAKARVVLAMAATAVFCVLVTVQIVKTSINDRDAVATKSRENQPAGSSLSGEHPYGRPAKPPMPWEDDGELETLRSQHGAKELMAAFQTTLPDPLFGEEENVAQGARHLRGAIVGPGKVFSLDQRLGPRIKERGYGMGPMYSGTRILPTVGGGICKIASTLYNVIVLADLPVVERHPHSMLVPYVPPGQDATISRGTKDFKFKNPFETPLIIWSQSIDRTLFIAIYGPQPAPSITWEHEITDRVPPVTVTDRNWKLPRGSSRVVTDGYDGMKVRSWVMIQYPGQSAVRKNLSTDWYQPMPRLVEVNP